MKTSFGIGVLRFDRLSLFAPRRRWAARSANRIAAPRRPGAGYESTKNIGGRVEFEGEKVDVDLISVGVLYRF